MPRPVFMSCIAWSYNKQRLDFDDARRLAQALGAEVDGLIHRDGIVRQRGAKVTVPDAAGRAGDERLGEGQRRWRGGASGERIASGAA